MKGPSRRLRRAAALLLAILCLRAPSAGAVLTFKYFSDLNSRAWYAEGVRYCIDKGLMQGYGYKKKKLFGPNDPLTRAQLVTILWRLEGGEEPEFYTAYADVPRSTWYAEAVDWGTANGLVTGYENGLFGPNDPTTREQVAAILYRYANYRGGPVPPAANPEFYAFDDRDEISDYAWEAVRWACGTGIMTGGTEYDRAKLQILPARQSTRAEVATMLLRYLHNIAG